MAARYWVGGTANWDATAGTKWATTSGGAGGAAVPTSADDVYFDAASGANAVIIGSNVSAKSINFTGFTGSFSGPAFYISVYGNVTLDTTYTTTSTAYIQILSTSSITSNGASWEGTLLVSIATGGSSVTIVDDARFKGYSNNLNNATNTVNGANVYITGGTYANMPFYGAVGTATFILSGNVTVTSMSLNDVNIDCGANTVNFDVGATYIPFSLCKLTYISGNITSNPLSVFNCYSGITLDTSLITFGIKFVLQSSSITLLSNLNCTDFQAGSGTSTVNGFTVNIGGNLIAAGAFQGTSNFILNGTGTWSGAGTLKNNLTINTAGTITVSGTVVYNTGTLTYTSGTVDTTGSTLSIAASTTLNTNGIIWSTVNFSATAVHTLISDLTCVNILMNGNGLTFNGSTVYVSGNFNQGAITGSVGTTNFVLNGTGTWSGAGGNIFKNNLTINTIGTITISGTVGFSDKTLTYISGTVVTTGSTLSIAASNTLNTNGITWNNITTGFGGSGGIITLTSNLNCKGIFTNQNSTTFNGNTFNLLGNISTGANGFCLGTTLFYYNGIGNWSGSATISNNFTISNLSVLIISGSVSYNTGTLTIEKQAKIITRFNTTLTISSGCTLININKCNFKTVTFSTTQTVIMNEFFSGSPDIKTNVRISAGTNPYNITFTDNVPKKAFHVNVQYCSITNRNQLNIINRDGNAGFNQGIIFGESGMSGFPLNMNPVEMSYPTENGLINNMIQ